VESTSRDGQHKRNDSVNRALSALSSIFLASETGVFWSVVQQKICRRSRRPYGYDFIDDLGLRRKSAVVFGVSYFSNLERAWGM
jgi:hypothetical protein